MSQDNQNSQLPSSPNQSKRKPSQRVQPAWKSAIIRILRGTIGVLETTVNKLETQPSSTEQTLGFFQKLQLGWSAALRTIRAVLPANLSTKLSDTALTGIITGVAVILFWTTSTVFTSKSTEVVIPLTEKEPPATIATQVEPPSTPPTEETSTPQTQETPPPIAEETSTPQTQETPLPIAEETPTPQTQETPPPIAEQPPAPPVEETPPPEPEPTPTPTIILTPEQTLIATIENQVAEISDRFASGLIQSIQANFRSSSLIININDEWYNLKQPQQDKLAAEMLQRSKELDFIHLDIIDSQGKLVARNPVVGTEMVIFQRRA